jgi:tetratricopeptide (TPR) repeat protein
LKLRNRLQVGIPLVIFLAVLAVFVTRWGMASLNLWKARTIMQQIRTTGLVLEERRFLAQVALKRLNEAQRLDPGNPDILDQLGQFLYWQAMNEANAGTERTARLQQAVDQYRKSLRIRPLWPYTWANLVVAKAEWGIFDGEFRNAVRRTVETGPWEPRVQLQLIRVDFAEQERIDRNSRDLIDIMLQRAIQTRPEAVLDLAARWRQLPRSCSRFSDEEIPTYCKKRGRQPSDEID